MKKNILLSKVIFSLLIMGSLSSYCVSEKKVLASIASANSVEELIAVSRNRTKSSATIAAYDARMMSLSGTKTGEAPSPKLAAQPVVVGTSAADDAAATTAGNTGGSASTPPASTGGSAAAAAAAAQAPVAQQAPAAPVAAPVVQQPVATIDPDDAKLEACLFIVDSLLKSGKYPNSSSQMQLYVENVNDSSNPEPTPSVEAQAVLDKFNSASSSYKLKALGRLGRPRRTAAQKRRHAHLVKEKGGKHNKEMQKRKKADAKKRKAAAKKAKKHGGKRKAAPKKHRGSKRKAAPKKHRSDKRKAAPKRRAKRVKGQTIKNNSGNSSNKKNNSAAPPAPKKSNNGSNNGKNASNNSSSGDATSNRINRADRNS